MSLVGAGDYVQVRALLGPDISEEDLPDPVIDLPVYRDTAETWALARVSDPTLLSAADAARLHRAAIRYLAGLLAPSLPDVILQRDSTNQEERRRPIDRRHQSEVLMGQAATELQAIIALQPFAPVVGAVQFILAPGRRGR